MMDRELLEELAVLLSTSSPDGEDWWVHDGKLLAKLASLDEPITIPIDLGLSILRTHIQHLKNGIPLSEIRHKGWLESVREKLKVCEELLEKVGGED